MKKLALAALLKFKIHISPRRLQFNQLQQPKPSWVRFQPQITASLQGFLGLSAGTFATIRSLTRAERRLRPSTSSISKGSRISRIWMSIKSLQINCKHHLQRLFPLKTKIVQFASYSQMLKLHGISSWQSGKTGSFPRLTRIICSSICSS